MAEQSQTDTKEQMANAGGVAVPPRQSAFKELGSSGRSPWGDSIVFQETDATLRGLAGVRTYDKIRRTDHTGAAMWFVLSLPIRHVEWRPEPASDAPADVEAADFLGTALNEMSTTFEDVLADSLTMFPYGWSFLEMVMKRREDGRVGFKKIALRPQATLDRWEYAEDGDILGMWQYPGDGSSVFIPLDRSLLFRTTREGDEPEGLSVYRPAVRPWKYRMRLEQIEGIGLYRRWAGFPTVNLPPGATTREAEGEESDEAKAENLVKAIYQDRMMGTYLPDGWTLNLGGPQGDIDTTMGETIIRKDAEMARAILAQFLMLGLREVGTQALANTLMDAFFMAIDAFLEVVTALFNRYMVPYLFKWYIDAGMSGLPVLVHSPPRAADLKAVAAFISALARNEMITTGDRRTEDFLRSLIDGMPASPEPEDTAAQQGGGLVKGETDDTDEPPEPPEPPGPDEPPGGDEDMAVWVQVPKAYGGAGLYQFGADKLPPAERLPAYHALADANAAAQRENLSNWTEGMAIEFSELGEDATTFDLERKLDDLILLGLLLFRQRSVLDIAAAFWLGFGSPSGPPEALIDLQNEIYLADAYIGYNQDGTLRRENPEGRGTLFGDIKGSLEGRLGAILLLLKGGKTDEVMAEIRGAVRSATRSYSRGEQYSGHVWRAIWKGASYYHDRFSPVAWVLDPWAIHCDECPDFGDNPPGRRYASWDAMVAYTNGVLPGFGTECDGWCRCHIRTWLEGTGWVIM